MRIGKAPALHQRLARPPARVTICMLVHVPNQIGYYARRLEVLRLSLASLVKHTNLDESDLMVFDNGSCAEAIALLLDLRARGVIRYLILSATNVGMANAYQMMFRAAPGTVVAYSDDDVLFYPGWLEASLQVLDTFPDVGMVSGLPVREQFRYGNQYLAGYLARNVDITARQGRFTPDEWQVDFGISIGRESSEYRAAIGRCEEILLEHRGTRAYSTATHFQYVASKEVMLRALSAEWDERLMDGPDTEIDVRIDAMGYARLSTEQRFVRHLGNVIDAGLIPDVAAMGLGNLVSVFNPPRPLWRMLAQSAVADGAIRRLWNAVYFARRFRPLS